MNQSFYTAAVGAQQQMQRMNVQGNNIANVNTYGYKAEKAAFRTLMYGMVDGVEAEIPQGSGGAMLSTTTDQREGVLADTGRPQDYAIAGEGFFALYEPATGAVTYTRDGSFTISMYQEPDEKGALEQVYYLSDGEGRQVLNPQGYPIVVEDPSAEQPVGTFTFQYQDGLQHAGGGRFTASEKNGTLWVANATVRRGFLELSNTDLAEELTKVIEAQRAYSYALRMVQTSDEVESTVINLKG